MSSNKLNSKMFLNNKFKILYVYIFVNSVLKTNRIKSHSYLIFKLKTPIHERIGSPDESVGPSLGTPPLVYGNSGEIPVGSWFGPQLVCRPRPNSH